MSADVLSEVLELPIAERIKAVQAIWDSVAAKPDQVPVTPDQQAELELRLREYRDAPEDVRPWDEVERRLRSRD